MPINKHAKGVRIEAIAQKKLEAEGYLVESKNWNRFKSKDFFGIFDKVALRGKDMRWIQVKSNKNDIYRAKAKINEWIKQNGITNPPHSCEIWVWITKDEFEIIYLN